MTVFVDASALVAILTHESDWLTLSECLLEAKTATTSALALYEAALAIARKSDGDPAAAEQDVVDFLVQTGVGITHIDHDIGLAALAAHRQFGKGRHPAALNMGDCFAYACAKKLGVPLLFKGRDFTLTDIRSALEN
jgi:ribonuclease VapC